LNGENSRAKIQNVREDSSAGTEADIQAQVQMLFDIQRDLDSVADMVNVIEAIRSQLVSVRALLEQSRDGAALKTAAEKLERKFIDLEEHFIPHDARWPPQLVSKLTYLADGVANIDFPPTTQQREVHGLFKQQIVAHRTQFDALVRRDLAAFNELLRTRQIGNIITTTP
jgi:hypothetical protein